MTQRFEKAYNALVNAYFNGTLAKGTCTACAVGNIVAAGIGAPIEISCLTQIQFYTCIGDNSYWGTLFSTCHGKQRVGWMSNDIERINLENKLFEDTGYFAKEIVTIYYNTPKINLI